MMTDLCEPLVLVVLGRQSPPDDSFESSLPESSLPDGLDDRVYGKTWVVKSIDEKLVVVRMDDEQANVLEKSYNVWMRSWDVWRTSNPTLKFRRGKYKSVDQPKSPEPEPSAMPFADLPPVRSRSTSSVVSAAMSSTSTSTNPPRPTMSPMHDSIRRDRVTQTCRTRRIRGKAWDYP